MKLGKMGKGIEIVAHAKSALQVVEALGSSEEGLSESEAKKRLRELGPNELKEVRRRTLLEIFVSQFGSFLVLALIAAAAIAALLGELLDASAIAAILLLNAVFGAVQESRAERAIEALRAMLAPMARVLRERREMRITAREIVPGDIVLVEAGDRIPADLRLIEAAHCECNEASLTGESTPVAKEAGVVLSPRALLSERRNCLFMGTTLTSGRAKGIVFATGMRTEFGKIAASVQAIGVEATPLRAQLERLGKRMTAVIIVACAAIFSLGAIKGIALFPMFLTSVSLAVAAIPEGLPAAITVALALGVQRMSRRKAIVRRLMAVETLGCTNVILSDKTGTITKNEMVARRIYAGGKWFSVTGVGYEPSGEIRLGKVVVDSKRVPELCALARIAALCNNASLAYDAQKRATVAIGDPTEAALLALALKAGFSREELKKSARYVAELPFDSARKRMTVIYQFDGDVVALTKGAVELLLERCSTVLVGRRGLPLTPLIKRRILAANKKMASGALRVLAFAQRSIEPMQRYEAESVERGMTFIGLVGVIDAPREEVPAALELCGRAGIEAVMITGDNELTAAAIAKEVGMLKRSDLIVTGRELDAMSDEELIKNVEGIRLYARVTPEHKLRIVNAWKARGKVVAVTGDGVNDAPALKRSDIGVAMGVVGTDVAREVSDVVLADDNFATIVNAVEEGRGIYDNIRKCIAYLLSGNVGEVLLIATTVLLGLPLPLLALQILWINLVTDGLPVLALAIDPIDRRAVMQRPPRPRGESIWRGMRPFLIDYPLILLVSSLALFSWSSAIDLVWAQTMVFTLVVMFEKYQAFSCRSLEQPIGLRGIVANKALIAASLITFVLHLAILYTPLSTVFRTKPLGLWEWVVILFVSALGFLYLEAYKALHQRRLERVKARVEAAAAAKAPN